MVFELFTPDVSFSSFSAPSHFSLPSSLLSSPPSALYSLFSSLLHVMLLLWIATGCGFTADPMIAGAAGAATVAHATAHAAATAAAAAAQAPAPAMYTGDSCWLWRQMPALQPLPPLPHLPQLGLEARRHLRLCHHLLARGRGI